MKYDNHDKYDKNLDEDIGLQTQSLPQKDADLILESMPCDEELIDLSELFKVFGDSTRIKIIYALKNHEICVFDLATILNMSQSAISHQLRILRNAKLVKQRKDGKQVFYSLDDYHVGYIFQAGLDHINEER